MATFSYAQAAKGQVAPAPANAPGTPSSPAVNGQSTDSEDAHTTSDGPQIAPAVTKGDVSDLKAPTESTDATVQLPEVASPSDGPAPADTQSSSVSLNGSRREDDDTTTEASTRQSDKGAPRSPSSSTRATDDTDAKKSQRKPRKGKNGETPEKKGKEAEKEEAKEEAKVELFEAPIPSVNIWAQRQEAQAAKGKAPAATRAETAAPAVADAEKKKNKPETVTPSSVQYNTATTNGARPPKSDGDANARRTAPRGSRVADKAGALPPVGDSASWPTPETAIKEAKPSEKTDKIELQDENGANKTRRREWERIDFVPTVNWETPIPATRGSRGGRTGPGTRGGRDPAARTGQNGVPAQTAEKSAEPMNTAAKVNGEQRERTREGGAHRANSQPPVAGKTPSTDAPRNEQKKAGPAKSGKPRDNGAVSSNEPSATRGEGRGERGRGGFHRGRGGGHAAGNSSAHGQNFVPSGGAFPPQAGGPRGNHYMSPPLAQGSNAFQGYGATQGRGGGRGNNRGQPGFSGRGNGHNGGSGRPRPISTHNNYSQQFPWDPAYAGMPMTAPPYPQQINYEVKALLTQQVEYYFSLDNLCKDDYLRTFMDSQGFVPLSLVRSFQRVSKLCGDNLALLRAACADMTLVDLCMSPDGIERLRSRQHPVAFVLPLERRQESARNPGPESYYICNLDQYHNQMAMGMMGVPYGAPAPYMNGGGFDDGSAHMNGSQSSDGNGQLSAAVPEFQPGALNGSAEDKLDATEQPLTNGTQPESLKSETLQS
ncbi:La domain-containing protein [Plectosphaerella plurivora]|uniref:La domain-containing protein n=1 Tax=Plectosphaerella plurivora TaxID=936078 RepID=A0A9P8VAP0_9PEZI|nr:La domain-containing protein [Plectosphaerella plurivora]